MNPIFTTITHRPYVFAFLLVYVVLAWRLWGPRKMILWLISGYLIAWASEFSSIHNGFPYGEYHYVYENLTGELLVAGVPFFDSLSYPFLIFAGYTTAQFICAAYGSRLTAHGFTALLGAFLTMLLDVIIDPIATMGDKWFLGKIHFYANPEGYFGVPFTNFGGWFLVSFAVIAFNLAVWRVFSFFQISRGSGLGIRDTVHGSRFTVHGSRIYPAFYMAIALFNIAVTFWVGEWKLGIVSSCLLGTIIAAATFLKKPNNPLDIHRRDC